MPIGTSGAGSSCQAGLKTRLYAKGLFVFLVAGGFAAASVALVAGQAAAPAAPARTTAAQSATPVPVVATSAADERALLDRYCVGCHSQKARNGTGLAAEAARKLALDGLDTARIHDHTEAWETVVRKLRAGMMPPAGLRRPEPATLKSMIAWLEGELDRGAAPYMPPPGLHRLNRTEYANAIRDRKSVV